MAGDRKDYRQGETGRTATYAGWTNRFEPRHATRRTWRAGKTWRRNGRCPRGCDCQSGRTGPILSRDEQNRARSLQWSHRSLPRGSSRVHRRYWPTLRRATEFYDGWIRQRDRLQPRRVRHARATRAGPVTRH